MRGRIASALLLSLALGLAGAVLAQDARPDGETERMNRRLAQRFAEHSPAVGELLPDLVAYDTRGEKVRLRELVKGHYTVLVLGCLT